MKTHNGSYPCPVVPIPGWMSGPELEWLYQRARMHRVIVEVGCAYGKSSHAILTGNFEAFGSDGRVYCVDCWPEPIRDTDEFDHERKAIVRRRVFLNWCGEFPNLNMWEMPSVWAAGLVHSRQTIDPGMVFIDGGTVNMVKDLALWGDCKRVALLCGHDYDPDNYPDLAKHLDRQLGLKVAHDTRIWFIERDTKK
jgi:hypothetical protein